MRNKKSKSNPIHFGIEVTKPHSKDMYNHNDKVAEELKSNILKAWVNMYTTFDKHADWSTVPEGSNFQKLQKELMYSGYGDGYTIKDVNDEFHNELDMIANWQLHQVYARACFEGLVPRVKQGMIGHGDWEKMDYWTDEKEPIIDIIKRVAGNDLRWSSHADVNGYVTKHPYIKVYNRDEGNEVVDKLLAYDIDAYVDCYEADDGDDDYGRPIMINFWSVKINGYSELIHPKN
jgi:hypothetical protein